MKRNLLTVLTTAAVLACGSPSEPAPIPVALRLTGPTVVLLGDTATYEAAVLDGAGEPITLMAVAWEVSDSTIIFPIGNMRFSALKIGTASISAFGGGFEETLAVTVSAP